MTDPCPCCGNTDIATIEQHFLEFDDVCFSLKCEKCGLSTFYFEFLRSAIADWNETCAAMKEHDEVYDIEETP